CEGLEKRCADMKALLGVQVKEKEGEIINLRADLERETSALQKAEEKRETAINKHRASSLRKILSTSPASLSVAFFKWAQISAYDKRCSLDAEVAKHSDEMDGLKRSLSSRFESETKESINTARKQASEYCKKVQLEHSNSTTSLTKDVEGLRVKCGELSRKLNVAGEDRELLKKRILELNGHVKALEAKHAVELRGAADAAKQQAEAEVSVAVSRAVELEKSKLELERGRCLLELEKSLRKEHMEELKEFELCKKREFGESMASARQELEKRVGETEARMKEQAARFEHIKESDVARECEKIREDTEKRVKTECESYWRDMVKGAQETTRREESERHSQLLHQATEKVENGWAAKLEAKVAELGAEKREQINRIREASESKIKIAVGEERARSARMLENARNELSNELTGGHAQQLRGIVERHKKQLVDIENKWLLKVEELQKQVQAEVEARKEGVKREADKWEKVVEGCEQQRLEEVRELQCSGREEAESERRQITEAAKKAIEEARRRYNALRAEFEKVKSKLVDEEGLWKKKEVSWKKKMGEAKAKGEEAEKALEEKDGEVERLETMVTVMSEEAEELKSKSGEREEEAKRLNQAIGDLTTKVKTVEEERAKVEQEGLLLVEETKDMMKSMVKKEELDSVMAAWQKEKVDRGEVERAVTEMNARWKERARVWDDRQRGVEKELKEKEGDVGRLTAELSGLKAEAEETRVAERRKAEERERALRTEWGLLVDEEGKKGEDRGRDEERREGEKKVLSMAKEMAAAKVEWEVKVDKLGMEGKGEREGWERRVAEAEEREERERKRRGEMAVVVGELEGQVEDGKRVGKVLEEVRSLLGGAGGGRGEGGGGGRGGEMEDEYNRKVEELKKAVDKGKEIEDYVRETEASLKDFNNHKGGGNLSPNGGFNIANVKKGRRLNEELEDGLRLVEGNRRVVKGLQREIGEVNEQRRVWERGQREKERQERERLEAVLDKVRGVLRV
ncbi:hypothetical protein TeGR_g5848, partial [Tetraparma gracilis]